VNDKGYDLDRQWVGARLRRMERCGIKGPVFGGARATPIDRCSALSKARFSHQKTGNLANVD